jgi:transcription initiation factor TFIID TATA-box-binding protein
METVSTMGTGSVGRELELEALVSELQASLDGYVEANFTSSGIVTFRLDTDGPAYTMYRTGAFQIRGSESEEQLYAAAERLREVLDSVGVTVPEYEFSHATSVFMDDIGREVNLSALAISLGLESTEYEPEQFPGMIYRASNPDATVLIFATGKVIVSGTTDRGVARSAIEFVTKENKVTRGK